MPTFRIESADLEDEGPRVTVSVGLRRPLAQILRDAGEAVPTPITATGMIDTGASGSAVRTGLLGPLGLHPVGLTRVKTASTGPSTVICSTYAIQLTLPNHWLDITVIETELDAQEIDVLIGRDVLSQGLLIYQGTTSQYTLSF